MKLTVKIKKPGSLYPSKDDGWEPMGPTDFFTIDPGMEGTGWALWRRKDFKLLCKPLASGSIVAPRADVPWYEEVATICRMVVFDLRRWNKTNAQTWYVEEPTFMEGGKGMVTARSGSLVKLISLYGAILGASSGPGSFQFVPVHIADWKGQCPKDIIKHRVLKRLSPLGWQPTTGTTHEMDAVGIGLYIKGHL